MSERVCSRWSACIIAFFSIRKTEQAVIPVAQYADGSLFASLGNDRKLHLAGLQVKDCIRRVSLREDGPLLRKEHGFPALADRGQQCLRVEFAAFLGNWSRTHHLQF